MTCRVTIALVWMLCACAGAYAQAGESNAGDGFDMGQLRQQLHQFDRATPGGDSFSAASAPAVQRPAEKLSAVVLRIAGYLALVIGVIVFIAWLMRRGGLAGTSKIGGGNMDLLEHLPLGQNRGLLLVRVADTVLVLGQTAGQITVLEKYEGAKALELISSSKGLVSVTKFKDALSGFLTKMKK